MPITIERHENAGAVTLVVGGEIDLTSAPELERAVLAGQQQGSELTIDLRAVEFIDSSGLQILLDADIRAREDGTRLVLVTGDGEAARVLELAQVAERLHATTLE